jgi:GNAT superfamily N-acetyltransferase
MNKNLAFDSLNAIDLFSNEKPLERTLNQNAVNEFLFYLKKVKYVNKIQKLVIEYQYSNSINKDGWLYLVLIQVKKSQKNKGFGTAILKDIINFADKHQVVIKLWPTEIYGSDYDRLIKFYKRNGFDLESKFDKEYMIYKPKTINHEQ